MLAIDELTKIYDSEKGKRFGRERAVDSVTLNIPEGAFFTLLGPSGCGKTTLLRCVSGLEVPSDGEIRLHDRVIFSARPRRNVPPNRRNLGMVFQSYAIWPHLTVFANAEYPLAVTRKKKMPRAERRRLVLETLDLLGLSELANRSATALSGGQQQRLALARAIVDRPPVLLLDEPLSNLDARLRHNMRTELTRLQQDLGLTVLYVTHDQDEALAMSTSIAVMNEGRVLQVGPPVEIYERPVDRFVGGFVGSSNFLKGQVTKLTSTHGGCEIRTSVGRIQGTSASDVSVGESVEALIRPECLSLRDPCGADGGSRGTVRSVAYQGRSVEYEVDIGNGEDLLKVTGGTQTLFGRGDDVDVMVSERRHPVVA